MHFTQLGVRIMLMLAPVFLLFSYTPAQEKMNVDAPHGILLGDNWDPETRDLNTVFSDQTLIDLGETGTHTVEFWTEIRNGSGRQVTWVFEYGNGMRQEVWTQRIRYDRFRTYLKKTFRRRLWNASTKQLVDSTGPCMLLLIDKRDNNRIIATKSLVLK